ncbi:MAG: Bro-N domain-containing protein [Hyphomicrobiaceae bacterium]
MARKSGMPDEKIKDFTSLADHDASIAKEGQITVLTFDTYAIRRIIHNGEPFYSVVDSVGALAETQAKDAGAYWRKLKQRLLEEGGEQVVTDCHELKLPAADGKGYRTDCANIQTMFRIIQSIPSKKAEPFKQWLAKVGFERIRETAEPSRMARRMVQAYRDLGYSDDWIDERLQQAVADAQWDEELGTRGVKEQSKAPVRAAVHQEAFGLSLKKHRLVKGATDNSDLPDRMNNIELLIDRLAKTAGTEIMRARGTQEHDETRTAALDGAKIAGDARKGIETQTKRSIITKGRDLPAVAADRKA